MFLNANFAFEEGILMNIIMDASRPKETITCWVDLYSDDLLSWAYHKTFNKEAAEDLVQDTFLAAVKSFSSFEGKSEPKTWLFSILNNKIRDHYRKQAKELPVKDDRFLSNFFDEEGHWLKEAAPTNWGEESELLDNPEFQKILNQCMQNLPTVWLMVVQLKYLQKKEGKEICKELEITPSNLWQLVHRSKLQLRKCIEINWFKN